MIGLIVVGGLVALGLIAEVIDKMLPGQGGGTGTQGYCPQGQCSPDRNHVLTDHFKTETYTSAGRRGHVPSVQAEEIPQQGTRVEMPAKRQEEVIEIAPGSFWKVR